MIIYFSGTGNSAYTAKRLATEHERVISIGDCMKNKTFDFEIQKDESIGFILPVYFFGIPTIVLDFISRIQLTGYKNQYTYCVFTMGTSAGDAVKMLGKALHRRRLFLHSGFSVTMPDSYILILNLLAPEADIPGILTKAELQIDNIKGCIEKRQRGVFNITHSPLPQVETKLLYLIYKYGRATKPFNVNEQCISCGLCERLCPCSVITMKDGHPHWETGKCTQCLACLHKCPTRAINYGTKTQKRGRYKNPNI